METVEKSLILGSVVKSRVGRDRKRVFIVVGFTEVKGEMRLLVTDGRLRKTDKPKLKNPRHVRLIGRLGGEEIAQLGGADDESIRKILASYDEMIADEFAGKNI